mmetsp:Transcript_20953/g.50599  ORF Transcript_20953/g.50599 Transcript_20953/m.50599 type:complete len:296 (+) Transcript_20953:459-1346(+)
MKGRSALTTASGMTSARVIATAVAAAATVPSSFTSMRALWNTSSMYTPAESVMRRNPPPGAKAAVDPIACMVALRLLTPHSALKRGRDSWTCPVSMLPVISSHAVAVPNSAATAFAIPSSPFCSGTATYAANCPESPYGSIAICASGVTLYRIFLSSILIILQGVGSPEKGVKVSSRVRFSSNFLAQAPLKYTALTSTAGPMGSSERMLEIFPWVFSSTNLLMGSFPARGKTSEENVDWHALRKSDLTSPSAKIALASVSVTLGSAFWSIGTVLANHSSTAFSSPITSYLSMPRS